MNKVFKIQQKLLIYLIIKSLKIVEAMIFDEVHDFQITSFLLFSVGLEKDIVGNTLLTDKFTLI